MNAPGRLGVVLFGLALTAAATPQAGPTFTEVNVGLSGLTVSKVNWGDYDNDGDLDLAFLGWESGGRFTRLYRNSGGTFSHETSAVFEPYNEGPIIFGDYDNDGDLDLAMGGWGGGGTGNRMYRNDGGGTFVWLNNGLRGMKGADGAWGDMDNDGDLDLVLVGESYDLPQGDYAQVYRNDGNGVFALAADLTGLYEGKVALGDYDRDGDLDIALSGRTVGSRIYRNDGGSFTDIVAGLPPLMYSAVAWGDYDNDGDLDLALFGGNGSVATHFDIYRNNGGTFTALGAGLPPVHFGELDWADYDNDGDPDLLMAGLLATGTWIARVYRNDGGAFADAGLGLAAMENAATSAWGDYDNDGDLDIIIAGHDLVGTSVRVYRNNSSMANTPPAVPILSASVSGNQITYSWTASTDAQTPAAGLSYNLRVGTTPGGQQVMAAMSNLSTGLRRLPALGNAQQNLSWTVKNLPAGTYYASVQAVDGGFVGSGWSGERTATILPPPTPGAFTLSSPSNGSVDVPAQPLFTWTASSGATSYTLQVSTDSGFSSFAVNQSGIGGTSISPAVSLADVTTYFWRVFAVNSSGTTLATGAPRSFTTGSSPPAQSASVPVLEAGGCGGTGLEGIMLVAILFLSRRRRMRPFIVATIFLLPSLSVVAQEEKPATPPPQDTRPEQQPPVPETQETVPLSLASEMPGIWAGVRGGAWIHPEFEAVTPQGARRIKGAALGEGGVDLGYRVEAWSIWLSFDYAMGDDIEVILAGAHLGYATELPLDEILPFPVWAQGSLGGIGGRLDVDLSGFGDFDPAWGFQARLQLSAAFADGLEASLWMDYRIISFEYEEATISGDDEAFGSTFALGGALTVRF